MSRLRPVTPAEHVLEVVTPRTNAARLSSAEHLFGALGVGAAGDHEPVSLEIVGDCERRRFLVRTASSAGLRRLAGQLGSGYPQAVLRPFDASTFPTGDPAQLGPDEQVAAVILQLRRGDYLPLRMFEDRELDTSGASIQADPLLGVLGAMIGLPGGWRAVAQLVVLAPASPDWARDYQRLALERPLDQERRADTGPSLVGPLALLGAIGLYQVGVMVSAAWSRGDWLGMLGLAGGSLAVVIGGTLVVRWLRRRELVDPRLVQAKLGRDACQVELRLGVFAPTFADPDAVQARLDQLVSAYRPYTLAAGNGLSPRPIRDAAPDLRILTPILRPNLLNVRELAGLWHLPQSGDDVALVERTTARRRLPLPGTVGPGSGWCRLPNRSVRSPGPVDPGLPATRFAAPSSAGGGQDSARQVEPAVTHRASPDADRQQGRRSTPRRPPTNGASSWSIPITTSRHPPWRSFRARARATLSTWMCPIGAGHSASTCSMSGWAGTATRPPPTPCASSAVSLTASGGQEWRTPSDSPCSPCSRPTSRCVPKTHTGVGLHNTRSWTCPRCSNVTAFVVRC